VVLPYWGCPHEGYFRPMFDRHYQALRLEMMALFADIGIACG
jgi:hypothetical protein